jgi:hypothetical protein
MYLKKLKVVIKVRALLPAILLMIFMSCANHPKPAPLFAPAEFFHKSENESTIYVCRNKNGCGRRHPVDIFVDGFRIAKLDKNSHTRVYVQPGSHVIVGYSSNLDIKDVFIEVKTGAATSTYLLWDGECSKSISGWHHESYFKVLNRITAIKIISKSKFERALTKARFLEKEEAKRKKNKSPKRTSEQ